MGTAGVNLMVEDLTAQDAQNNVIPRLASELPKLSLWTTPKNTFLERATPN